MLTNVDINIISNVSDTILINMPEHQQLQKKMIELGHQIMEILPNDLKRLFLTYEKLESQNLILAQQAMLQAFRRGVLHDADFIDEGLYPEN